MPAFELFATAAVDAEALWALVRQPRRLPEWTDVERVTLGPTGDAAAGDTFTTVLDGRELDWRVVTAEKGLIEVVTTTARGRLGVGARVVRDRLGERRGARLVVAGRIDVEGTWPGLRAQLVDLPAVRRRFDRWTTDALRVARDARP